jgi:hypothetical protein
MANDVKSAFLNELGHRFGHLQKLGDSLSLFKVAGSDVRIYIRYSKRYGENKTWYGLREKDFQELEGYPSFLCFLWDGQIEPLLIPYSEYEDVFQSTTPADDGQYKVQVLLQEDGTELYIARAGRFNVEGYFGWDKLERIIRASGLQTPELSHSQIQTLLGSIGSSKSFDVWIPPIDRPKLDWSMTREFFARDSLPYGFDQVEGILSE